MFDYYDEELNFLLNELTVKDSKLCERDFCLGNQPSRFNVDHYYARRRKLLKQVGESRMKVNAVKAARQKWKRKKDRYIGVAESGVTRPRLTDDELSYVTEMKEKWKYRKDVRLGIAESGIDSSSMGPVDTRQGVQLTSREITSVGERTMYTGEHDMSDATIKELPWDLSRIIERPTLVTAMQWQADMTDVLYTGAIPAAVLPIKLAKIPFQTFQYWRGDVTLRLQVAGSPIVQGILAMTFVPLVSKSEMNSMSWDFSSLSINPTVYLFANTNTHAELRIPYNHFQSYLNTNFPPDLANIGRDQNLGYVQIYVLQPLITVGSVTSVTVSLFSIFENNQFKVPRLSSSISALGSAESGFLQSALSSITDAGSNLISPVLDELGTQVKSMVSQGSNMDPASLISSVASKALPSNFIGDALDVVGGVLHGALGFLGLDNPTLPTETGRSIVKAGGSMNYAIGPEFIEKLSVMPSAMSLVTPETFATVTDEMDVDYLYRKYSYVGSFDVTNTDPSGAVVWSVPLSPFPTFVNHPTGRSIIPIGSIIQKSVAVPLLSYLGLPYRYWTGGLKYKFIVSASSLHTCRLYVAFNYGSYSAPSTLLDASSQYGVAIEISQGSNEFEFAVPYVATQPYLEVTRGEMDPSNTMGYLNVVVMNPLVAPTTVAPNISIVVFIAGSDDFSYEWLCQLNPATAVYQESKPTRDMGVNMASLPLVYSSTFSPYRRTIYASDIGNAESGLLDTQSIAPTNIAPTVTDLAVGDDDDDEDEQVAPPQAETCVDDHFGITSISLRNLLKKYQLVKTYKFGPMAGDTSTSLVCRVPISDLFTTPGMKVLGSTEHVPDRASTGLLSWASSMFRQFKGSLRFKVILSNVGSMSDASPYLYSSVFLLPGFDPSPLPDQDDAKIDAMTMFGPEQPVFIAPTFAIPMMASPRLCVLNGVTSNVLEFEVPYTSKLLSTLTYSGDNIHEEFHGLGVLYITTYGTGVDALRATVFAAFGDEARFGTLYRVPLLYAPAYYTVEGSDYSPTANFGYGLYGIPENRRVRRKQWNKDSDQFVVIGNCESGPSQIPSNEPVIEPTCPEVGVNRVKVRLSFVSLVANELRKFATNLENGMFDMPEVRFVRRKRRSKGGDRTKSIGQCESAPLQPLIDGLAIEPVNPQTGTGRVKPRRPFMSSVVSRVRKFIGGQTSVSFHDVAGFINTLSKGKIPPRAYGGIIYRAGGVPGRDGMIQLSIKSRYKRNNRRPKRFIGPRLPRKQGNLSGRTFKGPPGNGEAPLSEVSDILSLLDLGPKSSVF